MHSALCLHYGALHIPSATNHTASIAWPYSSFRPSSLSLSSEASTYRTLSRHAFSSPVICALDKPSTPWPNYDKDNGKKIVRVVGGASVVLACVLGIINCNYNFSPRAIAAPRNEPQLVLSDPKVALDSLLRVNKYLTATKSHSWRTSKTTLELPDRPEPAHLEKLKTDVENLITSGRSKEAEIQLHKLIQIGGIPGNHAEMELVRLLILQGKYKEASECNCLKPGYAVVSDAQVHLYKAIIYTMLDNNPKAEECWQSFVSSFSTMRMLPEEYEVKQPKASRPKI